MRHLNDLPTGPRSGRACSSATTTNAWSAELRAAILTQTCITFFRDQPADEDEPSNLVTLCDGCHAAHHPKLAGRLARRVMEKWAVRLALWLDRHGAISEASRNFGAALRLFGLERFRDGQLPVVEAALCGQSVLVVSPTGFGKTLCFQLPAVFGRV